MFPKPDINFIETDIPVNHWCSSGHTAPEMFKREGSDGKEEITKFFKVSGKGIDIIICEPCLILAHYLARQKRKLKEK